MTQASSSRSRWVWCLRARALGIDDAAATRTQGCQWEASMNHLDTTARYGLKVSPAETLAWLVPELDPDLEYSRWLDTEMIAFPGEPQRRCDTVAELLSQSHTLP